MDHAACFDHKLRVGEHQSAQMQAVMLRRTFVNGFNSGMHFGIPTRTLPQFIVLASLSGERVLLHSNDAEVARIVLQTTGHPVYVEKRLQHLRTLEEWAKAKKDSLVILTYVLPWQEGVGSSWFECRTATLDRTGVLQDGQKLFTTDTDDVEAGHRPYEPETYPITLRESSSLHGSMTSCCVSPHHETGGQTIKCTQQEEHTDEDDQNSSSNEQRVLKNMLVGLQQDRKKIMKELDDVKKQTESDIAAAIEEAETRAEECVSKSLQAKKVFETRIESMERSASESLRQNARLESENIKLKTKAATSQLRNQELECTFSKEKKALIAVAQASSKRVSTLEDALKTAKLELVRHRDENDERNNRKISSLTEDVALLRARERELNITLEKLSDVCDRRDTETESLNGRLKIAERRVEGLEEELQESNATCSEKAAQIRRLESSVSDTAATNDALTRQASASQKERLHFQDELQKQKKKTSDLLQQIADSNTRQKNDEHKQEDQKKEEDHKEEDHKEEEQKEEDQKEEDQKEEDQKEEEHKEDVVRVQTRSVGISTCNTGTSTTMVASTQTSVMEGPGDEEVETYCVAEAARRAHIAFLKLAELAQIPDTAYEPAFKGHLPPRMFVHRQTNGVSH